MNIAFILGTFFPKAGGVQVQVHNIANKLSKLGIGVKLFIYNKTDIKNNIYEIIIFEKIIFNIVFVFKYYLNLNIFFFLNSYILKIIKKNKIDIWHFNFLNFKSLILINILKKYNQKIIVTFHGIDLQIDQKINYGYRLDKKYDSFLKNTLKKIDKFTYLSETIKEDLIKLGVEKQKLIYFPNSVNIQKFEKIASTKNQYDETLNFITVARFAEKKKGFDLIQKICSRLIEKNINFKWKIIGENSQLLYKNKFIKSHSHMFEIIGNIENFDEEFFPHSSLINHYKSSDIYLNLSRIESFGITFIEALACKIPIISFAGKGVNEIIKNEFNGFLVQNNNISEFISKIYEIKQNKHNINKMRNNCVESVRKFDLSVNSNRLINIYNSQI
tara:strand:+ start:1967 stop:3127 length:1161 start_codon:yes stop_codon:yes gene_type:complete